MTLLRSNGPASGSPDEVRAQLDALTLPFIPPRMQTMNSRSTTYGQVNQQPNQHSTS
jgi:hypothetical protein